MVYIYIYHHHHAPGSNGIAAILLQKGGDGTTALIHGAIAKVWRKGEALAAWKDVGMLVIYKGKKVQKKLTLQSPQP